LIAVQLMARINEEFGVKISQKSLISTAATVEALAREIAAQLASEVDAAQLDDFVNQHSEFDGDHGPTAVGPEVLPLPSIAVRADA
jgi:molybdopterin converting factor small subunit